MNGNILKFAIVAGLLGAAAFAHAQTVVFNVKGTIVSGTCTLQIADKDLGSYSASLFTGSYQSGFQDIPMQVFNCSPTLTTMTLKVSGTADTNNAAYFKGLPGVAVELRRKSNSQALVPSGTTYAVTGVNNFSNEVLQAQFRQTATLTPSSLGAVTVPVTVTATYQ